ncbi:MAG: DUF4386 domain-containing protein [Boseongicola sp.]|nr:DUF4386 domain-containing protein [Boseongicola sp.]NNJ69456.1 DUF4386 domain-containing protein [Boseongicola sp.]
MDYDLVDQRRTGAIVGVLFIIATTFLFLGEVFYRPILDSPDFLELVSENRSVVIFGLLIEFICIFSMPLIGAFIFPVLARVSTGMALTYFFLRGAEGIILSTVALTNKFALVSLSDAVQAGADPVVAESARALIMAQNAWGNTDGLLYNIIFAMGALCLYGVLYRARLVPRWIAVWGILAILVLLALVLTAMFVDVPSGVQVLLVPIGVQEMVMALWFIFRGFDFGALEAGNGGRGS